MYFSLILVWSVWLQLLNHIYILAVITVFTSCVSLIVFIFILSINFGFLSEVKSLKVFITWTTSTIDQPIEVLLWLFSITILINEFFYCQVASSHSDDNLVSLNLHEHSLLSIFVYSFWLSHKVHLWSKSRRSRVNILG